jgi:hypothetical protein
MASNSAQGLMDAAKLAGNFDAVAGTNPNYRVWMWKGPNGPKLSTPMPENWSTSLDITWAAQFASLIQDAAAVAVGSSRAQSLATLAAAGGFQVQNKLLASKIWQGTSDMTINIPFIFKVEINPEKELINPIKTLLSWALPTGGTGASILLKAPYAPFKSLQTSVAGAVTGSTKEVGETAYPVTVQFGNFFQLPSCVITSINQTYDSIFDKNGKPLSAKVDVTVMSTTIITVEDTLNGMFL